jgi:hypothetical protein
MRKISAMVRTVFLAGALKTLMLGDSYIINAYVTYETGAWLFAAEVNFGNSESGAFKPLFTGADIETDEWLVDGQLCVQR